MMEKVKVINTSGEVEVVELITYLISDDKLKQYIVYSKGEVKGTAGDQVIYISKLYKTDEGFKLEEISDDLEWRRVQRLLKRIANAN